MTAGEFAKATSGAITAASAALGVALTDGGVTPGEIAVIVLAAAGGFVAVFATKNADPPDHGAAGQEAT